MATAARPSSPPADKYYHYHSGNGVHMGKELKLSTLKDVSVSKTFDGFVGKKTLVKELKEERERERRNQS